MRATLLLLVALAAPALADQTVWKWVDKDGVTHYSDRPVSGAGRVELRGVSRSDPVPVSSSPSYSSSSSASRDAAAPDYRTFEIVSPGNDESIVNTGGRVSVRIRLEPTLQPGHSVALYMDGRLVEGFAGNALQYELNEVPRGTHTVVAVISDARGTRVKQSPTVTFHVRQHSVAQPPVGPALRPPPKPQPRSSNKLPTSQPSYAALNGERPRIDPATNAPKPQKSGAPAKPGN